MIQKLLKFVRKSPSAEIPHHTETDKQTRNANQWAGCKTTRAQNHTRFQKRP